MGSDYDQQARVLHFSNPNRFRSRRYSGPDIIGAVLFFFVDDEKGKIEAAYLY